MSEFLKPQSPLQHKDGAYVYPLTTADQVILEDNSRLNAVLENLVTEDKIHNAINAIDFPVDSVNGKTGAVTLTAADVGALSNNGFSTHSTVLEAAMAMPKQGGSFFAVNGSNLFYAEDTAFSGREVTYLMLTDESSGAARRTVVAIAYGLGKGIKYRTIWSGAWQQSDWEDITSSSGGGASSLDFTPVQQGGGIDQKDNKVKIGWSGSALKVTVDGTDLGEVITTGYGKNVVPIANGGTGASTVMAAVQNLFNTSVSGSVTSYPTEAGIYRTVGTEIFSNLTATHGVYGVLVIFKAAYGLHIYVDHNGRFFWGHSGDNVVEPEAWYQTVTEAQVTTMINNALGVIENGAY